MSRCIVFIAALLPTLAFAQPYLPGKGPALQKSPTRQLSPKQKLAQYRHDQINLLALRADAPSLIAAALLAQPDAKSKTRPAVLKTPALLKRAQRLDPANPLVWWVSAGIECAGPTANTCPNTETLQKLEQLDAQNAAVWALSLWRAQRDGDVQIARAALTSAAQARQYNDYFGAAIAALYAAQSVLPMSSDLLLATGEQANVDGYRLTHAAGIVLAVLPPASKAIVAACGTSDKQVQDDCVNIANKMSVSGSLNARRGGLDLLKKLLRPGARMDAIRERVRHLAWLTRQIGKLGTKLANDGRVTYFYTHALQSDGDEVTAVVAVLRSQGVSLHAPPGWQPPKTAD